jgi:lipoate-protein ligase A
MVAEKKLVGSAQKRTEKAVLQHGSIPLTPAYRNLPDFLQVSESERHLQKMLLASKSICCSEINSTLTSRVIQESLIDSFCRNLPLRSFELPWSDEELHAIATINQSMNNA